MPDFPKVGRASLGSLLFSGLVEKFQNEVSLEDGNEAFLSIALRLNEVEHGKNEHLKEEIEDQRGQVVKEARTRASTVEDFKGSEEYVDLIGEYSQENYHKT
ncbi:Uncharacterized protein Fot_03059 [Forsythia ovata]|uniref:Uncharacterized protein n=1 Tax=Forsythia ovata TaxID=205694 RepID=A0ABD1XCP2_9LAMI